MMSDEQNEDMPTTPAPPVPTEISLNGQTFEITTNAVDQSVCVKPVAVGGAKKARKSSKKQKRRSSKKQHRKSSKKPKRKSGKK